MYTISNIYINALLFDIYGGVNKWVHGRHNKMTGLT